MTFCPIDQRNPLKTREDMKAMLSQMLDALLPYYSEGGAGVNLGYSGYHYTDRGAWLEGYSRALWGIGPLVAGGGYHQSVEQTLRGLRNGTDPMHEEYWGDPEDYDQRLVEMTAIGYSILLKPEVFWDVLSPREKSNVYSWLNRINQVQVVDNNWNFFRVLVNLAFDKVGMPYDENLMEETLCRIDSMYREEGWFQDGNTGAFDYYNSLAFHFYSMIYYRERKDIDQERCMRYREYAILFAQQFRQWFSNEGMAFPFGRSQTYRFAQVSSFVAAAMAGIEVIPWGECKWMVLNHLRSWVQMPIFERDGVLSIGYGYPNLVMSEIYNAPGSPYWSFKLFGVLALQEDHPFWRVEEQMPTVEKEGMVQKVPGFLIQRLEKGNHVVALSGKQSRGISCGYSLSGFASKYGKFAYSSRYGFSISRNLYTLEQGAFDSMLALKEGEGSYYHVRLDQEMVEINRQYLHTRWSPWDDVVINTLLIPIRGGHIRCHHIDSARTLETAEGGFCLKKLDRGNSIHRETGWIEAEANNSYSRISDISNPIRQGVIVYPEPNTNLIYSSTMLPMLTGTIAPGLTWLCCAVYAGETRREMENDVPEIGAEGNKIVVRLGHTIINVEVRGRK